MRSFGQSSGTSNEVFWGQTPRGFLYTLSPSSSWGTGRVGKLSVEVDARKLRAAGVPISEVTLPGFTEKDGVYRWEFSDYDLRRAPDLKVVYDLGAKLQSERALAYLLPRSAVAAIAVSSTREPSRTTRATYGAGQLLDRDFSTAWIEGAKGAGVGEWIEVRIKKGWALRSVALANGYWKSAVSLAQNGWIKKVRLDWTWGDGAKWEKGEERTASEVVTLKRPDFDGALQKFPYGKAKVLQEFGEMGGLYGVSKLRLTILEAEPGASADTAVSELILLGEKLDR